MPSRIPCSLSSYPSYPLFSWTRGVPAHLNSSTHRFPRCPLRNLCSLVTLLCPHSSPLQRTQPSVKLLSLWDWQNREYFLLRLLTLVPGHLSSHSALFSYGLFARSLFGDSVSLRSLVQALESCPTSGAPWFSAMPPSLGRDRVTTTTICFDLPVHSKKHGITSHVCIILLFNVFI